MDLLIRRAEPHEAAQLSAIAVAAKAHWGYPAVWLEAWRADLTIDAAYIAENPTFVATADDHVLGFHAVVLAKDAAVLDHLWVRPESMRRGVGRRLFRHAEDVARGAGRPELRIVGDPNAEGFYRAMGAEIAGWQPAPMEGVQRALPRLRKRL